MALTSNLHCHLPFWPTLVSILIMFHDLSRDLSLVPLLACHWATLLSSLFPTNLFPSLYALSFPSYCLIRLDYNMQISSSYT